MRERLPWTRPSVECYVTMGKAVCLIGASVEGVLCPVREEENLVINVYSRRSDAELAVALNNAAVAALYSKAPQIGR